MADLSSVIAALQAVCRDVRAVDGNINETLSDLDSAISAIRQLDDGHANNAAADVNSAIAELRTTLGVWTHGYARSNDDLCRRLAA